MLTRRKFLFRSAALITVLFPFSGCVKKRTIADVEKVESPIATPGPKPGPPVIPTETSAPTVKPPETPKPTQPGYKVTPYYADGKKIGEFHTDVKIDSEGWIYPSKVSGDFSACEKIYGRDNKHQSNSPLDAYLNFVEDFNRCTRIEVVENRGHPSYEACKRVNCDDIGVEKFKFINIKEESSYITLTTLEDLIWTTAAVTNLRKIKRISKVEIYFRKIDSKYSLEKIREIERMEQRDL